MNNNATGHYASVNGLNICYEIHGTGKQLILLHGGVGGIEMFARTCRRSRKPGRLSRSICKAMGVQPTLTAHFASS